MKPIFLLAALFGVINAAPQGEYPQDFDAQSADEDAELIPIKTIEKHEGYEIQEIPASKWVCTKMEDVDTSNDPLNGWQDKYDNPIDVMSAQANQKTPGSLMFQTMFKYIVGANKAGESIEMTRPVLTISHPKNGNEIYDMEMCFWTGTPWINKTVPEPLKEGSVYVKNIPTTRVYAMNFEGWMWSTEDWDKKYTELGEALYPMVTEKDWETNTIMAASFNSPVSANQKHTVMMPVKAIAEKGPKGTPAKQAELKPEDFEPLSADEDAELLPIETVEEHDGYKIVEFPESEWACTKMENVDNKVDPLKGWQDKFENGVEVMSSKANKETYTDKMWNIMFKYIVGANKDGEEIEMTRPVVSISTPVDYENEIFDIEMCFWTGTPWIGKPLPEPLKSGSVYKKKLPKMAFYAMDFNGWMWSNDDWDQRFEQLAVELIGSDVVTEEDFEASTYWTASFSSPFSEKQKHSVMIPKMGDTAGENEKIAEKKADSSEEESSEENSTEDREEVPYKVIKEFEGYELREFQPQKWICSKNETMKLSEDSLNDWREKYDNNPYRAMFARQDGDPIKDTFSELFKFIVGVNTEGEEIDMTAPVVMEFRETGNEDEVAMSMCFWLGSEHQTDPPQPLNDKIYIYQDEGSYLLWVRKFSGWAISVEDWREELGVLRKALKADNREVWNEDLYYTAGYDHVEKADKDRRNEIWIPAATNKIEDLGL